jgi:DNA polymerase-3 subunit gamma/tau
VRYSPVEARYKVYIIDEVHMLSTAAFNALLKTLEEPPPHAKFIFATTEIRKVPVTILSRCQRFDLRRVEPDVLGPH